MPPPPPARCFWVGRVLLCAVLSARPYVQRQAGRPLWLVREPSTLPLCLWCALGLGLGPGLYNCFRAAGALPLSYTCGSGRQKAKGMGKFGEGMGKGKESDGTARDSQ
eukprot:scaffold1906_cov106-Isochrysis_galbana.AAC.19